MHPARWFRRWVLAPRWSAFVALGLSFIVFGAGTANLWVLLQANLRLIAEHGWPAVMDGAALQLLELLATTYASMLAWLVFKACEDRLVHGAGDPGPDPARKRPDEDRDPAR